HSRQLGDRHPAPARQRVGFPVLDAVRTGGEELLHRLAQGPRADAMDDADLRLSCADRSIQERGQRRDRLARALPDEIDLAGRCVDVGTVDPYGDALPRRRDTLDDAELRRGNLELETAPRDARALGSQLEDLAADAAAHDLDRVAGTRRAPRGGGLRRRDLG